MNITNPTNFGIPGLTLTTSNAEGTGNAIRTGASILTYDTTLPASVAASGSAGDSSTAARRNHVHPGVGGAGTVVDEAITRFNGTGGSAIQGYSSLSPTISDAGIISLTSGALKWPATAISSADANTLDDYEEGTWTPALADATLNGSGEGQGYSLQKGFYQRVGNWVTFIGWLTVTNKGSLTAGEQANIVGLPFASSSTASAQSATVVIGDGGGWAFGGAGQSPTGAIPVGGKSHFYLKLWDATTGVTTLTIAETTASLDFIFSGNYMA